jgi:peptidoglycan/xylan/chitin deacetylase (PgdA/CDA1 family)
MSAAFALALLAAAGSVPTPSPSPSPSPSEGFAVAVTVDDLPAHGPLPPGETRLSITRGYLAVLAAHHVPEAFGFVNAGAIDRDPDGGAALDAWRAAGQPLGNHTFSHLNLDDAPSLEAWEADVVAGEPAVAARMKGADWRYLRFPYLQTGTASARHDGAQAFLTARGYRIASISLTFNDWAYTEAYARCAAKGDAAAIGVMESQYLGAVEAGLAQMRAVSQRVYGRMIPQVLLTHIGAWSARTLPAVLDRLDAAGARYITLDQAQSDPAYAQAERYPGGDGIMERTAKARGVDLADLALASPEVDVQTLCR